MNARPCLVGLQVLIEVLQQGLQLDLVLAPIELLTPPGVELRGRFDLAQLQLRYEHLCLSP